MKNKLDFKRIVSLDKESGQRKLTPTDKLGFKTIVSLKKESGQRKLTARDK